MIKRRTTRPHCIYPSLTNSRNTRCGGGEVGDEGGVRMYVSFSHAYQVVEKTPYKEVQLSLNCEPTCDLTIRMVLGPSVQHSSNHKFDTYVS